jgi:hypothetical protein
VLKNKGDGTYLPAVDYEAGKGAWSVALGDLDGDGDLDIVVANGGSKNISVLKNKGDGTFAQKVNYKATSREWCIVGGPRAVTLGDLDGDGDLDMVVANYLDNEAPDSKNVFVLKNKGDGTFGKMTEYRAH